MHWAHSFSPPAVAGRPFGPDPAPAPPHSSRWDPAQQNRRLGAQPHGQGQLPPRHQLQIRKKGAIEHDLIKPGPALDHFVAGRSQAEEGDRHHGNSSIQLPGRVLKLLQVPGLLICRPPWATAATSALSPPGVLSQSLWLPHDCPAATAGSLSLLPAQSDSPLAAGAGRCTPGSAADRALGPP